MGRNEFAAQPLAPWSIILNWVLSALVDTKFYTLFAFLFGLGFSIQLTRAEARGISIVPVYCRRLLALLLIGLAHALLLRREGDASLKIWPPTEEDSGGHSSQVWASALSAG